MNKKIFVLAIASVVITGTASYYLAPKNESHAGTEPRKAYAEFEKKDVYEKVSASWDKALGKLSNSVSKSNLNAVAAENDWIKIAGPDIDIKFINDLPSAEQKSFNQSLLEVRKATQIGDHLDVVLVNKNKDAVKIVWERKNGDTHVAEIVRDGKANWNISSQEDIK